MERRSLLVSPSAELVHHLSAMLSPCGIALERVETVTEAQDRMRTGRYGVILTSPRLRDGSWLDVVTAARKEPGHPQVLVAQSSPDAHFWTDVLEAGGYDVLSQPFHPAEVQRLFLSAWLRYDAIRPKPVRAVLRAAS